MQPYPFPTSREEKLEIIKEIKARLLKANGDNVLAIGAYGSIALCTDGPYSDIELHVVTKDGINLKSYEFIYDKFKIEISTKQKSEIFIQAKEVDDSWSIKAGIFTDVLPIYDPEGIFEEIKGSPFLISDIAIKDVMREFMVWEPYETIAKIRNNYRINNLNYIPMGAKDLVWQTAKLIGLANKQIYSTRARTYEESLQMKLKPLGYDNLVAMIMDGNLNDKEHIYILCENLWIGLNDWYEELGIDYKTKHLPL
jgi:kanamycin nucleotidyltransferase